MRFAQASTSLVIVDYGEPIFCVGFGCLISETKHDGVSIRTTIETESVIARYSRN